MAVSVALGEHVKTFQFDVISRERKVQIPLIAGLAVGVIISLAANLILQSTGNLPKGPVHERELMTAFVEGIFVTAPFVFILVGIPLWRIRALKISVYADGLCFQNKCWQWSELGSLLVTTNGITSTILVYQEDQAVIYITYSSDLLAELIELLRQKTIEKWLPRLTEDYKAGKSIHFGNLIVNAQQIQQNSGSISPTNIRDYLVKDQTIILRRESGLATLVVILFGVPNGHQIPLFLKNIFPEARQ